VSAIADLVTFLLSTGIPPESVSVAVNLATQHGIEQVEIHRNSTRIPPETAAEKRKAWDRERKRKIAETKKPPLILTSFSEEILSIQGKKEESKRLRAREKKRLGPLPENWRPPANAYGLAIDCGTTVPIVEAIFRDYLKSSGKLYADHDAAFCNFVRNQNKFNGTNGAKNGRRTVHDAAKDLHENILARVLAFDEPAPSGLCGGEGADAVRLLPPGRRE
jgi:hypothetical protein